MENYNKFTISSSIRKKLIEQIDFHYNALEFSLVRLFICYSDSKIWENTNLEGYLILINDSFTKSLRLLIFDLINFNKEFEIELYIEIIQGYENMTDTFHTINYPDFFIGLNFPDKISAEKFRRKIFIASKIKQSENFFETFITSDRINNDNNDNNNNTDKNTNPNESNQILNTNSDKIKNSNSFKGKNEIDKEKLLENLKKFNNIDLKFKKIHRILEMSIETNPITNIKNPIVVPDIINDKNGKYEKIYNDYIKSQINYFLNIKNFYEIIKNKSNDNTFKQEKTDEESRYIEDNNNIIFTDSYQQSLENEIDNFKDYQLNKRGTIKINNNDLKFQINKLNNLKNEIEENLNTVENLNEDIDSNYNNNTYNPNRISNNSLSQNDSLRRSILNNKKKFNETTKEKFSNLDNENVIINNNNNNNNNYNNSYSGNSNSNCPFLNKNNLSQINQIQKSNSRNSKNNNINNNERKKSIIFRNPELEKINSTKNKNKEKNEKDLAILPIRHLSNNQNLMNAINQRNKLLYNTDSDTLSKSSDF
jgi:hypothetical protein